MPLPPLARTVPLTVLLLGCQPADAPVVEEGPAGASAEEVNCGTGQRYSIYDTVEGFDLSTAELFERIGRQSCTWQGHGSTIEAQLHPPSELTEVFHPSVPHPTEPRCVGDLMIHATVKLWTATGGEERFTVPGTVYLDAPTTSVYIAFDAESDTIPPETGSVGKLDSLGFRALHVTGPEAPGEVTIEYHYAGGDAAHEDRAVCALMEPRDTP